MALNESASKIVQVTADATLTGWGQTVEVDTSGGSVTLTLPPHAGASGRSVEIVKTTDDQNVVTIDGHVLLYPDDSVTLRSNGTSALKVAKPLNDGLNRSNGFIDQVVGGLQPSGGALSLDLSDGVHHSIGFATGEGDMVITAVQNLAYTDEWILTVASVDAGVRVVDFQFSNFKKKDGSALGTFDVQPNSERTFKFKNEAAGFGSDIVLIWDSKEAAAAGDFVSTRVDASAGVFAETLPASTDSGLVKLYTNIDVTNTATLAVQAGETLNGVTDGTFLFSNYSAGTQFRADEVAGGWVVSVVGASTQVGELHYITGTGTTTGSALGTANSSMTLIGATLREDPFDLRVGNTIVIKQSGRYYMSVTVGNGSANASLEIRIRVDGAIVARGGSSNVSTSATAYIILDLVEGQVIDFSANRNVTGPNWVVRQLPTNESVLAGMVTPEALTYLHIAALQDGSNATMSIADHDSGTGNQRTFLLNDSDYTVTDPDSLLDANGHDIVITKSGRYRVRVDGTVNAGDSRTETRVNGVVVSKGRSYDQATSVVGYPYDEWIGDLSVGDKVTVGLESHTSAVYAQMVITLQQLSTSSVVMPEALDVVDNAVLLGANEDITGSGSKSGTGTISQNWGDLEGLGYEFVEFRMKWGSGSNQNSGKVHRIATKDWLDDMDFYVRWDSDETRYLALTNMDVASNTFTGSYSSNLANSQEMSVDVYGIKAQKTVVPLNTDLIVEENEVELFSQTGVTSSQALTLANGVTWQDVVNDYDKVIVHYRNVSTEARQSVEVLTQSFVSTGNVIALSMGLGSEAELTSIDLSDGGFVAERSFGANVDLVIRGVKAQKTVTPADSIEVEDVETVLFDSPINHTAVGTLNSSVTWDDVIANYERVKVVAYDSDRSRAVTELYTSDIVLGSTMFSTSIGTTASFDIDGISTGVGTFAYVNTISQNLDNLKIVGIKAQKTVINTTDLPTAGVANWSDGDTGVWNATTSQFEPVVPTRVEDTTAAGTINQLSGTAWTVGTSTNPATGNWILNTDHTYYTQIGKLRYYNVRLYTDTDTGLTFEVTGASDIFSLQGVGYPVPGTTAFAHRAVRTDRTAANVIEVDRDGDNDADLYVTITFVAIMS